LGQTLDRVELKIAVQQTLVVTMSGHAGYIAEEFARRPRPRLVVQPCDRGTVAGILYPAYRIAWEDPSATIALFPSDHLVVDEMVFMAHVAEVAQWIEDHPDRTVLLGARPSAPEIEYGWIEPGERVGEIGSGPVRAVRGFWEKPSPDKACEYLAGGHLWNTSVLVAKARALLALGEAVLPDVAERLAQIGKFVGTPDERAAIHQAYQLMPKANFSRALLEASPQSFAVSRLPHVGWSDLGSPTRVLEAVTRLSLRPDWARDLVSLDENLRALDPTPA
jgi:mannose-1-phosphate guanylyltransferase